MLVRIVKDWERADNILQQTPQGGGMWDGIQFTFDDVEECDVLVVLNRVKDGFNIRCRAGNRWLIQLEPPTPAHAWYKERYNDFDTVFTQFRNLRHRHKITTHGALPWHLHRDYDFLKRLVPTPADKTDRVSTITSNANWMHGHKVRLDLIERIKRLNAEIDLYGRGFNPIEDKFDALYPYKYSLVIENSFYPHYWTEKIADCLLSWTVPIYIGAPNIREYFPEGSFIQLSTGINAKELVSVVETARKNHFWENNIDQIKQARNLILDHYQLFPYLVDKIGSLFKNGPIRSFGFEANIAPWEGREPSLKRKIQYQVRKFLDRKPY